MESNRLFLNVNKTVFVTFSIYTDKQPVDFDLRMHEKKCTQNQKCNCSRIDIVDSVKYLGVTGRVNSRLGYKTKE